MQTNDVEFSEKKGRSGLLGIVTLKRADALNALDLAMTQAMTEQLLAWKSRDDVTAVVMRAEGARAFCAGGDLKAIYAQREQGRHYFSEFAWHEYRLNHLIYHYPKPYVALVQGVCMGGGAGISVNGSHRVASDTLCFAMPETAIGLFPDVGASYFLSRCPGQLGFYLGLTGLRIHAADAVYAGLFDVCVSESDFDALVQALCDAPLDQEVYADVSNVIERYRQPLPDAALKKAQLSVDDVFACDSVAELLVRLEETEQGWCLGALKNLRASAPFSLCVTFEALRRGASHTFDECLRMEYRLAQRFAAHPDFYEGIRALMVDKDRAPVWQPASLDDVSTQSVQAFFSEEGVKKLEYL